MYVGGEMALPPDYDFLALDGLRRDLPDDAASRVVLALDSATAPRTRIPPEVLEAAPLVIDVDHHHDNTRFGAINLVVADASSTGEIVRDLLRELDVALTPEIAEAIYVALDTDTGRFQYANTTQKAHALAGELMDAGVEPQEIFRRIYESVPFARQKLKGKALDRAQPVRGRPDDRHLPAARRLRGAGRGGGVRRGRDRRAARGQGRRARDDRPRAADPRRACRAASRCARRATRSTSPRSRGSGRAAATSGRRASRATSRSRRSSSSSAASSPMPPRALKPRGLHPGRQAGRPVVVPGDRRDPAPDRRAHRPRGHARPVRDRAAARALRRGDPACAVARRPRQAVRRRRSTSPRARRPAIRRARSSRRSSRPVGGARGASRGLPRRGRAAGARPPRR